VLAFRLLQDPWSLTLDLERVDAWVQVTGLQHLTFGRGAGSSVAANLQYEIENTGVKSSRRAAAGDRRERPVPRRAGDRFPGSDRGTTNAAVRKTGR
jgi:hypothetical protein